MNETPSTHPDLSDQTLLRSNKIKEIRDYFITEILEREPMVKKTK